MFKRRKFIWRVLPGYLLMALIPLARVSLYAFHSIQKFQTGQMLEALKTSAILIADELARMPDPWNEETVMAMCRELGTRTGKRITVVLPDGAVVADSEKDPADMENHADRPEVRDALAGQVQHLIRYSDTLRCSMLYLGYPLEREGRVVAAVRTSVPLRAVDVSLRALYGRIGAGVVVAMILAALASVLVSRSLGQPIEAMRRGADRFAREQLDFRLAIPDTEELAGLAESMNSMAAQLDERIRSVVQQRSELEALLTGMVEGVLAVDREGRVLRLNKAAGTWFGCDPGKAVGHPLQEAIRNHHLQDLVNRVLQQQTPVETDLVLRTDSDRFFQVHGTPIKNADGDTFGVLVVLDDVTRLRRLETVRRDFIANASHELTTPVTSIKGFIETLQGSAGDNSDDRKRFLDIVARQADRLNAILEDILQLSRIEHDAEHNRVELHVELIQPVLEEAVIVCRERARQKRITVEVDCDPSLSAPVHPLLLEQAVINLLDNAVKYSPEETRVTVRAFRRNADVLVEVCDRGPGIDAVHLPRIFERFYRVDKGRSQQLGGTGLGLAIVRHIALAHGGQVDVDSAPGKGSTFSIRFPAEAGGKV